MPLVRIRTLGGLTLSSLGALTVTTLVACLDNYRVVASRDDSKVAEDATSFFDANGGATIEDAGGTNATDAARNDDGGVNRPPTFCDGIRKPVVDDYLCADFDSSPFAKGWDAPNAETNIDNLGVVGDIFVSKPFALRASTMMSPTEASLKWTSKKSTLVSEASASFQYNLKYVEGHSSSVDGNVELLRVESPGPSITFGIANAKANTPFPQVVGTPPVAYLKYLSADGTEQNLTLSKSLNLTTWNDLKLVWTLGMEGVITLVINGVNAFSVRGYRGSFYSVTFHIGGKATGDVSVMQEHRFDNVQLSVRR